MTPSQIILQDSARNGVDGEIRLRALAASIQSKRAIALHENNSVLVMRALPDTNRGFVLHLYTMDSPITLMKSLSEFVKTIKKMKGIQTVYGTTTNQQLIRLLRKLKVEVLQPDLEGYTWMAKV